MTTLSTLTANAQLLARGPANQASDIRTTLTQSLLAQNPGLKLLDAQVKRDDARLSNIGKVALALDDFRSFAAGLTGGKLSMVATASGNALTARLSASSATAGTHKVEVQQLAQGQKLASRPVADKDTQIGSGAGGVITVETGSGAGATKTTVRIPAGDSSLEGIARAMREAGLDAQVGQDGKGGYALSLNGKTGAANSMRLSADGDPLLSGMFSYQPGRDGGMQQSAVAQDARVVVDGKTVSAASNTLEAAIPGLTLNLTALGSSEVGVRNDPSAVAANVKDFVKAFNGLNSKLDALTTGDARSDTTLFKMKAQVGAILDGASARQLAELGISRSGGKNGALVLDEDKFKAAIAANPDQVTKLFSDRGGLAERMVDQIGRQIGASGSLGVEAAGVMRERDKLLDQKTKVIETVSRQASMMVQQYQLAGSGGSMMFGGGLGRPMSLFDYMA
jgi:flagellar hook-associated protein 2